MGRTFYFESQGRSRVVGGPHLDRLLLYRCERAERFGKAAPGDDEIVERISRLVSDADPRMT
ncbi:MAG: hypothetical protein ABL994_04755 [Verrucomicrobiales bacterium]